MITFSRGTDKVTEGHCGQSTDSMQLETRKKNIFLTIYCFNFYPDGLPVSIKGAMLKKSASGKDLLKKSQTQRYLENTGVDLKKGVSSYKIDYVNFLHAVLI